MIDTTQMKIVPATSALTEHGMPARGVEVQAKKQRGAKRGVRDLFRKDIEDLFSKDKTPKEVSYIIAIYYMGTRG